jgi:hypothetical protein
MLARNAALLDGGEILQRCLAGVGHLMSKPQILLTLQRDPTFLFQVRKEVGLVPGNPVLVPHERAQRGPCKLSQSMHACPDLAPADVRLLIPHHSSSRWRACPRENEMPSTFQTCTDADERTSANSSHCSADSI